jgi:hypothetical protein
MSALLHLIQVSAEKAVRPIVTAHVILVYLIQRVFTWERVLPAHRTVPANLAGMTAAVELAVIALTPRRVMPQASVRLAAVPPGTVIYIPAAAARRIAVQTAL